MIYKAQNIPDPQAYAFALSQPFVTKFHRRLLTMHRAAPDLFMYLNEMVAAINSQRHNIINSQYGTLGHKVADLLDFRPATHSPTSSKPLWTTALAEGGRKGSHNAWYWRMYPQVAVGIDLLGWGSG